MKLIVGASVKVRIYGTELRAATSISTRVKAKEVMRGVVTFFRTRSDYDGSGPMLLRDKRKRAIEERIEVYVTRIRTGLRTTTYDVVPA